MYGTQLAEEGTPACNIKGYDFEQYYKQWKCPRIALEAAVSETSWSKEHIFSTANFVDTDFSKCCCSKTL